MKRGFTLMELLIVIAIIGILISISSVAYSSAQKRVRDSRRQADLKALQNALEQYYADSSNDFSYPGGMYFNVPVSYVPGGEPKDPKVTQCGYKPVVWDTTSYKVCADLESVNGFGCSSTGCPACQSDFCVSSVQGALPTPTPTPTPP